jgi:hypothetical protein
MPLPSHDRTTRFEVLIVETALQNLWMSVPQAAVIWIAMLLVAAIAAATLTVGGRLSAVALAAGRPNPEPEVDDGRRYADEVAVAAERAAATAARRRTEWEQAQVDVDAAWAAYDRADDAARRAAAASAFPVLRRRRAPGENADRERYLHRTATAACRRREISIGQLNDALAHRGWDARKHPVVQEVALRNAVRAHRFDCYRVATARERQAWQTAEQAAAALRSLRAEALDAKVRAGQTVRSAGAQWWAEQWATTQPLPVVAA